MLQYHRKRTTQKNGNAWDLESIKQAHPKAARRVAISIISNAVEGITFDRYSYDSKSIWITTLLNNDKYHWLMIAISFLHCNMGFLGKKWNATVFPQKCRFCNFIVFIVSSFIHSMLLFILYRSSINIF